jgi:hypothetical protein
MWELMSLWQRAYDGLLLREARGVGFQLPAQGPARESPARPHTSEKKLAPTGTDDLS